MKKTMKLGFMMTLLSGLMFFASCDDNDEITPVDPNAEYDAILRLTEGGDAGDTTTSEVNVNANEQKSIKAKVTFISTDATMRRLYITQNIGGQGEEPYEITANVDKKADGSIDIESANSNQIIYELTLPVPSGVGEGTVVYKLWTTTGRGDYRDPSQRIAVGPGEIILKYGGSNPEATVNSYTAKMLAAPTDDGSSETFISTFNGELYQISEGSEYASFWDFGYYWLNSPGASLASTASYPALFDHDDDPNTALVAVATLTNTAQDDLNKTYFVESNGTDFDAVTTSSDLSSLNVSDSNGQKINNLEVGDIIAFVDSYGKKGLIRVKEIEPGFGSGDYIVIDVKVQP
ncbi:hypothetical protein GCM10009122_44740 [Fulvivirga kasyanovii]|uniref:DUF4625 domain-containing protein n=1 Tax=Fulvivirga kasyanovii TaxID=396812 RepID=A0ABW9RU94_9BACT|nr:hypothetical protein [Fulvivirga kasyanovii]MTI27752.1 hypothetical protein [Fulvivirga kasyanovii]